MIQRGANQARLAGNVVVGFDAPALAAISEAMGYGTRALLLLFHHAEQGLLQAVKNHGDVSQHTQCFDPDSGH